jgi:hypothetical protein
MAKACRHWDFVWLRSIQSSPRSPILPCDLTQLKLSDSLDFPLPVDAFFATLCLLILVTWGLETVFMLWVSNGSKNLKGGWLQVIAWCYSIHGQSKSCGVQWCDSRQATTHIAWMKLLYPRKLRLILVLEYFYLYQYNTNFKMLACILGIFNKIWAFNSIN